MSQKHYLPTIIMVLIVWLRNFAEKIGIHGATVGLSPAEITAAQGDCLYAAAVLEYQQGAAKYAQDWTKFKDAVLYATEPVTAFPPDFTVAPGTPPITRAGVIALTTLLVARIKAHPGYRSNIGEELRIVADESTLAPAEVDVQKPVLKVRLQAGHPLIIWKKGAMDGIELWVDRGDGKGFVPLYYDQKPNHLDTFPLPAPGATAIWKYKGIYRLNEVQVGEWSDVIEVTVTGTV